VSENRRLGPAARAFFFGCKSIMRRRRKRRHAESGPAEFATAVVVDVGTNVNVNGGVLLGEDGGCHRPIVDGQPVGGRQFRII
jgi:hypothetical protein